ncbi:MAG: metallophosphoesterase [Balneolaceae bacterium]|nr:metallophosphoesterase [Balneolaceae bacterium]
MPWLLRMTVYASGLMLVVDLYLGWRLYRALMLIKPEGKRLWCWIVPVSLLLFYTLPLFGVFNWLVNGHFDLFAQPKPVVYLFWFGFVFSFQLLTWVIIYDVARMAGNLIFRSLRLLVDRAYGYLVAATALLTLFNSGWKLYHHSTVIQTDQVTLQVEELPESLRGFRIVHISDIQADAYTSRQKINRYIDTVNRLNPDLVLFTGDLISYGTGYIEMAAGQLAQVESTYGVFAVVGDHDYWAGLQHVVPALEKRGIKLLRDENRFIHTDSVVIKITGITHVYSKRSERPVVSRLTGDSTAVDFRLLAAHQMAPHIVSSAKQNNYRLLLAGHTHGGQVRVPFFFQTISASEFETPFINGIYRIDSMMVHVNSGLGYTLAPVRFNAPAKVSLIELQDE